LHPQAYSELHFDISNQKLSVYLPRCAVHPAWKIFPQILSAAYVDVTLISCRLLTQFSPSL
jgi:glucose-6-phosphate 1-dehydrogenase